MTNSYLSAADALIERIEATKQQEEALAIAEEEARKAKAKSDLMALAVKEIGPELLAYSNLNELNPSGYYRKSETVEVNAPGLSPMEFVFDFDGAKWDFSHARYGHAFARHDHDEVVDGVPAYPVYKLGWAFELSSYSRIPASIGPVPQVVRCVADARREFGRIDEVTKEAAERTEAARIKYLAYVEELKADQTVAQDAIAPETISEPVDDPSTVPSRTTIEHMDVTALLKNASEYLDLSKQLHDDGEEQSGLLPAMSQAFSTLAMARMMDDSMSGVRTFDVTER